MCCPKLALASSGLILDRGLLVSCLVQIFPGGPILLVLAEFLPYFFSKGVMLGGKHCIVQYEEEGGSRDGIGCPIGLLMGVFKRVGVPGDALHVQMVVLNFILQLQHTNGMEAATYFCRLSRISDGATAA